MKFVNLKELVQSDPDIRKKIHGRVRFLLATLYISFLSTSYTLCFYDYIMFSVSDLIFLILHIDASNEIQTG